MHLFTPVIAGIETIIMAVVYIATAAYAYVGIQQAKKASQQALARTRGILYQSRSTVAPRRLIFGTSRVGALECFLGSSGPNNDFLHYIFIWGDGPCQSVKTIFFDGVVVPFSGANATGNFAGYVTKQDRLGGDDNETPIAEAVANLPGWTNTDLLLGICYSHITLKFNETKFPKGVPASISAVIEGLNNVPDVRVVDSSSSGGAGTPGFTDNPALCLAYYLTLPVRGCGCDFDDEIASEELIEAANICDESVPIPEPEDDGPTDEKRYTFNGVILLDQDPEDIITAFRTAMAGISAYIGGKWRIYAGAYITPTLVITKDMIVGKVNIRTKTSKSDHINTMKGVFVSERNSYQPTDFEAVSNPTYVSEDGGEVLISDISLVNTNSHSMARRIASIGLERARRSRRVSLSLNVEGMQAQPGLPVILRLPEAEFFDTPMEVLEYGFSISDNKIKIDLSLAETDPSVFDPVSGGGEGPRGPSASVGGPPGFPGNPDPGSDEGGNLYSDLLEVIPSGASIDQVCRSKLNVLCCEALYDVRATASGVEVASECNYNTGPGFDGASHIWHWSIVPIGQGSTAGTTKFRCSAAADYFTPPIHNGLDIYGDVVTTGGTVTFRNGEEKDLPYGILPIVVTVVHGIGNPFGCSGSICVASWDVPWEDISFGGCGGVVAFWEDCGSGVELADKQDAQVKFIGTGYLGGWTDYKLRVLFEHALLSGGPYVDDVTLEYTVDADSSGSWEQIVDFPNMMGYITRIKLVEFGAV